MKKFFVCICILAGLLLEILSPAQAASLYENPGVMVLAYIDKSANLKADDLSKPINFSFVSEFVEEFLLETHRFKVVEREHQLEVFTEIARQIGGTVSADTITQAGRHLGAAYLIAGSVTGISPKESGVSYENSTAGGGHFNKRSIEANVTIRIIDVETMEIVLAAYGKGESARTDAEFTLKRKIEDYYETTTTDENGIESVSEGKSVEWLQHKVKIGSEKFTQAQVGNAIRKATYDAIFNKKFGLLAKMDGKGKSRKV